MTHVRTLLSGWFPCIPRCMASTLFSRREDPYERIWGALSRIEAKLDRVLVWQETLEHKVHTMSQTVSSTNVDIQKLIDAANAMAATVDAQTATINSTNTEVAAAVTALQNITAGNTTLSASDTAAVEAVIAQLGTVGANITASTAAISNDGSQLATALSTPAAPPSDPTPPADPATPAA